MNINGKAYRTIWVAADGWSVEIIDQTKLPHELAIASVKSKSSIGLTRSMAYHPGIQHGMADLVMALEGDEMLRGLQTLARDFDRVAKPEHGKYVDDSLDVRP